MFHTTRFDIHYPFCLFPHADIPGGLGVVAPGTPVHLGTILLSIHVANQLIVRGCPRPPRWIVTVPISSPSCSPASPPSPFATPSATWKPRTPMGARAIGPPSAIGTNVCFAVRGRRTWGSSIVWWPELGPRSVGPIPPRNHLWQRGHGAHEQWILQCTHVGADHHAVPVETFWRRAHVFGARRNPHHHQNHNRKPEGG